MVVLLLLIALQGLGRHALAQSGGETGISLPRPGSTVRFVHLSVDDGLPENSIECITQDREGFIWIGTRDGLSRFDGYQFVNYRNDADNPNSLSNNWVRAVLEDRAGQLWVATEGGGVNRFDPHTESFTRFFPDQRNPNSLGGDRINHIFEDSQGRLWFTGGGLSGLSIYSPATNNFIRYRRDQAEPYRFEGDAVVAMSELPTGTFWMAATTRLVRFDEGQQRFRYFQAPNETRIMALAQTGDGNLWVGGGQGLYRFDVQQEAFTLAVNVREVSAITPGGEGHLWLASADGAHVFDIAQGKVVQRFGVIETWPHSLSSNFVSAILRDHAGVMWLGTRDSGLNRYNPRQTRFAYFRNEVENDHSLFRGPIRAISKVDDRHVWVAGLGALNLLDLVSGQVERFSSDYLRGPTHALFQDRSGRLWIGTSNLQVLSFDRRTEAWKIHKLQSPIRRPTPPKEITSIFQDDTGDIWVVVNQDGLFHLKDTGEQIAFYESPADPPPPNLPPPPDELPRPRPPINATMLNPDGTVWLATLNGLRQFDPKTGQVSGVRLKKQIGPDSYIGALLRDNDGMLWLASHDGLIRYDPVQTQTRFYTEREGLSSNFVVSIQQDGQGRIWLGTTKGLSRFDPITERFRNFDVSDGLQGNEFEANVALRMPDGILVFGGSNGLNVFDPAQIVDETDETPVVLTNVLIYNKPAGPDWRQTQGHAQTRQLSYDQNNVSFEFAALNYAAPYKNRYRYRLDDIDGDWIDTDANRRAATYANLPSGSYIFRVQGSNADGVWSRQELALTFSVSPPWWQTWWFRLAVALLAISAIVVGYRWRTYSISERNRLLEQQIAIRTADLRDREAQLRTAKDAAEAANRAKSIFIANMSHELRSPLNAVLGFAQVTRRQHGLPTTAQENLEFILRSGQHLLQVINQVLDLSKIEADRMTIEEESLDLYRMLDDLQQMFALEADQKDIQLQFERAVDVPHRVWTDGIKLRQVLINLLSNAIKFTAQGSVTLRLTSADLCDDIHKTGLHFEVQDSGEGIAADELPTLFEAFSQTASGRKTRTGTGLGLRISHRIVQLLGGELTIESQVGHGSIFRFAFCAVVLNEAGIGLPSVRSMPQPLAQNQLDRDNDLVAALCRIPMQQRKQLLEFTEIGDMRGIQQTIDQIRVESDQLGAALNELAQRFDYDQLLALLREAERE